MPADGGGPDCVVFFLLNQCKNADMSGWGKSKKPRVKAKDSLSK
jgi:hypothetical protein